MEPSMTPGYCDQCRGRGMVLETRQAANQTRRRYFCPFCNHRWTTVEYRRTLRVVCCREKAPKTGTDGPRVR